MKCEIVHSERIRNFPDNLNKNYFYEQRENHNPVPGYRRRFAF